MREIGNTERNKEKVMNIAKMVLLTMDSLTMTTRMVLEYRSRLMRTNMRDSLLTVKKPG